VRVHTVLCLWLPLLLLSVAWLPPATACWLVRAGSARQANGGTARASSSFLKDLDHIETCMPHAPSLQTLSHLRRVQPGGGGRDHKRVLAQARCRAHRLRCRPLRAGLQHSIINTRTVRSLFRCSETHSQKHTAVRDCNAMWRDESVTFPKYLPSRNRLAWIGCRRSY